MLWESGYKSPHDMSRCPNREALFLSPIAARKSRIDVLGMAGADSPGVDASFCRRISSSAAASLSKSTFLKEPKKPGFTSTYAQHYGCLHDWACVAFELHAVGYIDAAHAPSLCISHPFFLQLDSYASILCSLSVGRYRAIISRLSHGV